MPNPNGTNHILSKSLSVALNERVNLNGLPDKNGEKAGRRIAHKVVQKAMEGVNFCIGLIWDRTEGKPVQAVQASVDTELVVVLRDFSEPSAIKNDEHNVIDLQPEDGE